MVVRELNSFSASDLRVIPRTASAYHAKKDEWTINGRLLSSMLLVVRGRYAYRWKDGSVTLTSGEMIYIPKGAVYSYRIETQDRFVRQIEFDTYVDGEEAIFSSTPTRFIGGREISELMKQMTIYGCGDYTLTAGLYTLIGELSDSRGERVERICDRIKPAVNHIRAHFSENVRSDELAAMCYLSQSQMRRLFVSELGMSPTEYRIYVRIKTAQRMFSNGGESVGTVSEAVGYESVFAFSKAFKRVSGISPKEYMERGNERRNV